MIFSTNINDLESAPNHSSLYHAELNRNFEYFIDDLTQLALPLKGFYCIATRNSISIMTQQPQCIRKLLNSLTRDHLVDQLHHDHRNIMTSSLVYCIPRTNQSFYFVKIIFTISMITSFYSCFGMIQKQFVQS